MSTASFVPAGIASLPTGPHANLACRTPRERFAAALFDALWTRYRERVSYVQTYEQVIRQAGATFVNDHIALRTFATQIPLSGICTLSRIFEALDYRTAGAYQFPDKHLSSVHLEPPHPGLPKVFISELQLWRLPADTRALILQAVRSHRLPVSDETLGRIANCGELAAAEWSALLERVVREFHELPWSLPGREDVAAVNRVSQFGAWVLAHGYNVNHFTSLINSHGVPSLDDIDKTVAALRAAGVPMKAEIEGAPGSRLRQTATEAVVLDVAAADRGLQVTFPWTYAYFELAERGAVLDPDSGESRRFEGFLGPQATHLFEMTRVAAAPARPGADAR